MNKEQSQAFVNKLEREMMLYVEKTDNFDRLDELDQALTEFDRALMKIMVIITEQE